MRCLIRSVPQGAHPRNLPYIRSFLRTTNSRATRKLCWLLATYTLTSPKEEVLVLQPRKPPKRLWLTLHPMKSRLPQPVLRIFVLDSRGRPVSPLQPPRRITSLDQLRPAKRVEQAVTGNLGVSWIRLLDAFFVLFYLLNDRSYLSSFRFVSNHILS